MVRQFLQFSGAFVQIMASNFSRRQRANVRHIAVNELAEIERNTQLLRRTRLQTTVKWKDFRLRSRRFDINEDSTARKHK